MPVYNTACPHNCYSSCSFKVKVEKGKIISFAPNAANRATAMGVCLKGISYLERVYSSKRILYPLRRSKKGTNTFERISWDSALTQIAEQMLHIRNNFGNKSILFYQGSGINGLTNEISNNFWKMFGGCTITYGGINGQAGLEATRLTLGQNKHNAAWDIENAKLIILWGKNPAESNIHQTVFIENAQNKGAILVVIDPRLTQSARNADLILQPRPGTDAALALCIANLLIMNNLIDRDFINENVLGYEEFKQHIKEYNTEKTSKISGIPTEKILKLTQLIGNTKPLTIVPGLGTQQFTNGGQTIRAILAINIITGNIGKKGAGWHLANLQTHIFGNHIQPQSEFPNFKTSEQFTADISVSNLGKDILKHQPPIKMIWVERANPVTQNPASQNTIEAFRAAEFRVVVEQFLTDTALEADIILPAKTFFEQSDISTALWHPYLQFRPKVINSPAEVKPETEIYYLLAQKLGYQQTEIEAHIPPPGDENILKFLEEKLKPFPQLSIARLREMPVLSPDFEEIAFENLKFGTPSGKIELYSLQAKEMWNVAELPDFKPPLETVENSPQYPLYLLTPGTKNRIHSQFNNLQCIQNISPKPLVYINPSDAAKRKIKTGQKVKVFNSRGEIYVEAEISNEILHGTVTIHNGWWIADGANVNFLTQARNTDMGYGTAFHDCMVDVI